MTLTKMRLIAEKMICKTKQRTYEKKKTKKNYKDEKLKG